MIDVRPANCRHRLQEEGKAYPRSSCTACGLTVFKGLGRRCYLEEQELDKLRAALYQIRGIAHGRDSLDGFPRRKGEKQRRISEIYEIAHVTLGDTK